MTMKTENDEINKICIQGATFAEKGRTSVINHIFSLSTVPDIMLIIEQI